MNQKFKDLTRKLSNFLNIETLKFLMENLDDEEDISDVINLVLSGHLSSLFTCMTNITSENEAHAAATKKFIDELTAYISKLSPIEKTEWLYE